jgi:hypothetical protein
LFELESYNDFLAFKNIPLLQEGLGEDFHPNPKESFYIGSKIFTHKKTPTFLLRFLYKIFEKS